MCKYVYVTENVMKTKPFVIYKHYHKHKHDNSFIWWCIKQGKCCICNKTLPLHCFVISTNKAPHEGFVAICSLRCAEMFVFQNI